jgi:hypothetical protein
MPTTGPAAVRGNAGAISAARAAAMSTGDQNGMAWFASNFNQAMDKYDRAAKLKDGSETSAASSY